jgi:hypothetical protein
MPDKYLYARERGYDTNGMWNKDLAATALRNIRSTRDMESKHLHLRCTKRPSSTTSAVLSRNVQTNTEAPQRKGQRSISAGFVKRQTTQHVIAQLKRDVIPPRQRWVLRLHGLHHLFASADLFWGLFSCLKLKRCDGAPLGWGFIYHND